MPYGFGAPYVEKGVMAAAAIIFFAFYGFDAIARRRRRPRTRARPGHRHRGLDAGLHRALHRGRAAAIGRRPFTSFAESPEPLALILRDLGQGAGASGSPPRRVALPTVLWPSCSARPGSSW
jgi:APA family basic amino acid/polyamine antiporter